MMKSELKKSLQNDSVKKFKEISKMIRDTYKNTPVVELKEIKDREDRVGDFVDSLYE